MWDIPGARTLLTYDQLQTIAKPFKYLTGTTGTNWEPFIIIKVVQRETQKGKIIRMYWNNVEYILYICFCH